MKRFWPVFACVIWTIAAFATDNDKHHPIRSLRCSHILQAINELTREEGKLLPNEDILLEMQNTIDPLLFGDHWRGDYRRHVARAINSQTVAFDLVQAYVTYLNRVRLLSEDETHRLLNLSEEIRTQVISLLINFPLVLTLDKNVRRLAKIYTTILETPKLIDNPDLMNEIATISEILSGGPEFDDVPLHIKVRYRVRALIFAIQAKKEEFGFTRETEPKAFFE